MSRVCPVLTDLLTGLRGPQFLIQVLAARRESDRMLRPLCFPVAVTAIFHWSIILDCFELHKLQLGRALVLQVSPDSLRSLC